MKTAARIAGWAALAAGAVALVLCALLLIPSVQRALLRRALVSSGATVVDLGNLHASPFGLTSDRIEVTRGGLKISGRSIVLRLKPAKLLADRCLEVTELEGRGVELSWDVEKAAASGPAAAGASTGSPMIAKGKVLALALAVDHLDLQGRFVIRRGAVVLQQGNWTLAGTGLTPAAAGTVDYSLALTGNEILQGAAIDSRGKIRLPGGTAGVFQKSGIEITADFTLPGLATIHPEAAPLGEVRGRLEAAVHGGDAPSTIARAKIGLASGDGKTTIELELLRPLALSPWQLPEGEAVAVRLAHFPLAWANPWLVPAKVAFQSGEVNGAGTLGFSRGTPVLQSLRLAASLADPASPRLILTLGSPLPLSPGVIASLREGAADSEVATLHAQDLPLAWISRWLPLGHSIEGRLTDGASVLHTVKGQGLVLDTLRPWKVKDFRFLVGDQELFRGDLQVSPRLMEDREGQAVQLAAIDCGDASGNRLQGSIGVSRRTRDNSVATDTRLLLDLPALPHSRETFGPLRISFAATARIHEGENRGVLGTLSIGVADARGRRLVRIDAERPVRIERTPQAEWLLSSADPLRFETAALPLAWLNPYLAAGHIVLGGQLQPAEMKLWLSPRHAKVASTKPISIGDFRLERLGEPLLDQGMLRFDTDLELDLTHSLLPKLHLTYSASIALKDGLAAAGGADIGRFQSQVGFAGDEKQSHLTDAGGSIWADLGALGRLPLFRGANLPGRGELSLALSKVPQRADAITLEAKVEHVAGRNGVAVPDLEISGRARANPGTRVGALRIQAILHSTPRPSDANFVLRMDNQDLSVLESTSDWKSTYVDFDAVRAFLSAFSPARPAAPLPAPAAAGAPSAAPLALALPHPEPAWGNLRGKFTLDIKTLTFGGYTLQNLSGRLGLTPDTLSLSSLSGDIFGAHCSASLTAEFHPGDPTGNHRLSAQFNLTQLDPAPLIARSFPNDAPPIDTRLDLALSFSSRANRLDDLFANAAGTFSLSARDGKLRLSLPGQEMRSNLTLLGTVTFSPELRALSRLLGEFSEMPLSRFEGSGRLAADGSLSLDHLQIEAPQLKLDLSGDIPDAKAPSLVHQPLAAHALLAAHGDVAVILGGMGLLGRPTADGFRPVTTPFTVGGTVGEPDLHELYDLLARAVSGSHGTWRLLMQKLQARIKRPSSAR